MGKFIGLITSGNWFGGQTTMRGSKMVCGAADWNKAVEEIEEKKEESNRSRTAGQGHEDIGERYGHTEEADLAMDWEENP
ncbi:hypothetical protein Ddye_009171 [Dipteronia dyeriana]|uniref:Uncharacterized protein n=1 Tax=Dipteronia dyeriana TaxID=168575 RepID=A0AAD9XAW3_9ROSI|nr:hypothetical protein Ddye_009171 [Dipteronia dyeriana]